MGAASIAFGDPRRSRTLTERRRDITTLQSLGNTSELAPEILSKEPGLIEVVIATEGVKRRMEFRLPHVPVPQWLFPTLERCAPLLLLPFDWNRRGAPPIEPTAIRAAIDALWSFMADRSSIPQWTPTRTGGVQLDWHENGIDLEMEFPPDAADGHAVFDDNEHRTPDWDGPITTHLDHLRTLFEQRLLIQ
jgi:hypothetical protein